MVLFEPTYDSYAPAVEVNGGRPVYVRLQYPDYSIDWNAVQQAITPKTRMIVINTPNNPTTSVFSAEDMRAFENILRNTNIIVVADEVYEHLIYDGHQHQSVARFPGLAERSFVVSSFGKTYSVTGWKMGYVLAPRELMNEFRKVHQFNVFVTNGPLQYVLAEYMADAVGCICRSPRFTRKSAIFFSLGLPARAFKRAAVARHFFPEPRVRCDQRREGYRSRGAAHQGERPRRDSAVSVLSRRALRQGAALLLRQIRADARERRRDPARALALFI